MSTGTRPSSPVPPPRVPRALTAASIASILACAAWGLRPVRARPPDAPAIEAAVRVAPTARTPLDLDAFNAPVWVAPPSPPPEPEPPRPPPPPPPLKLQLLAITREGGDVRAVLYDPDADRLSVVRAGDAVAGRRVERVEPGAVALRDFSGLRTLALREDRAGRTP